jgi:hypothetical protein
MEFLGALMPSFSRFHICGVFWKIYSVVLLLTKRSHDGKAAPTSPEAAYRLKVKRAQQAAFERGMAFCGSR